MTERGNTLLARVTGLEPATSGVTGRRSNQLSYTRSDKAEALGWVESDVKARTAISRWRFVLAGAEMAESLPTSRTGKPV